MFENIECTRNMPAWYRDELSKQTIPEQWWQRKRLEKWLRKQERRDERMVDDIINDATNSAIMQVASLALNPKAKPFVPKGFYKPK